jgi:hypothetical protein
MIGESNQFTHYIHKYHNILNITKFNALQVYVFVFKKVENLRHWVMSLCACVCVVSVAVLQVRFPGCSGGLVVCVWYTWSRHFRTQLIRYLDRGTRLISPQFHNAEITSRGVGETMSNQCTTPSLPHLHAALKLASLQQASSLRTD